MYADIKNYNMIGVIDKVDSNQRLHFLSDEL